MASSGYMNLLARRDRGRAIVSGMCSLLHIVEFGFFGCRVSSDS